MSLRPNPLAATTTSKRNTSPSVGFPPSLSVLLNRGYSALSYRNRLRKNVRIHSTSLLKYLMIQDGLKVIKMLWMNSYHSAFSCEVLTIWGKSMTIGSPSSRRIKMLNSLKSPWMSPEWAKRTMRSMRVEYNFPGDGTFDICRLYYMWMGR